MSFDTVAAEINARVNLDRALEFSAALLAGAFSGVAVTPPGQLFRNFSGDLCCVVGQDESGGVLYLIHRHARLSFQGGLGPWAHWGLADPESVLRCAVSGSIPDEAEFIRQATERLEE